MSPQYARLYTRDQEENSVLRSALRSHRIWYMPVSSRYIEINGTDEQQATAILQQMRAERIVAPPPSPASVRRGRLQPQGAGNGAAQVDSMEPMRPFLNADGASKAVYNRMSLLRQIARIQAQVRHWQQETTWLQEVAGQGGAAFSQTSFNLGPTEEKPCSLPPDWASWAQAHGGVRIRKSKTKPEPASFILTKDHALESAERSALSLAACERLVQSLRQQMEALGNTVDPIQALEALLGKLYGYTRFFARGGCLSGRAMPASIGGIDMGVYTVMLDITEREIRVEGGTYERSSIIHPHIYSGRP